MEGNHFIDVREEEHQVVDAWRCPYLVPLFVGQNVKALLHLLPKRGRSLARADGGSLVMS